MIIVRLGDIPAISALTQAGGGHEKICNCCAVLGIRDILGRIRTS
jgi:hypothetical protein